MNDFLHNLRNNGKRFDRPRKNYDNPQYRVPDRLNRGEKKPSHHRRFNDGEQMASIKKALDTITETAGRIQSAQDRVADAVERIADYLQLFAAAQGLQMASPRNRAKVENPATGPAESAPDTEMTDAEEFPVAQEATAVDTATPMVAETPKRKRTAGSAESADDAQKSEKEIVVDIIRGMREDGIGFELIAEHLEMLSMPTFSGKGKWRAQNVSRVFNMYANRG